jgi:aldehyde dehydrogenase (NAD+)
MSKTEYDKLFIGGRWVSPSSTKLIDVRAAATGELLGRVPEGVEADIDTAVTAARTAFDTPGGWADWEPALRAKAMYKLADALDAQRVEMARRVSAQNGMPVTTADYYEATAPAGLVRHFAGLAETTAVEETRGATIVRREPVGVVAAITPWNFPQALAFFKIAPALAAGCTVILKPPPETVLDAMLLAEAAEAAGLPDGVLNIVPADREASAYLVAHPGVDKVAFTGSTEAGRHVGATTGRLLRPATLELGGKSAAIILEDADLAAYPEELFAASFLNNGQTCFANTRVLAPASRYDEVVDFYTSLASSAVVGDPLDRSTQVGPLVSQRQRDRVESYIAKGRADGARLTTGGGRPAGLDDGWFVEPTVFADVDNSTTIAQEEIFGPVLAIIRYDTVDDAVRIANDSPYGLGGTVWSPDRERAFGVARRIRTGTVGFNGYSLDPVAPYGGVKDSGIGRELGTEGLASYQNLKSFYLTGSGWE